MGRSACSWAAAAAVEFGHCAAPDNEERPVGSGRVVWNVGMDAWSLGLTVWELFSDGRPPFAQAASDEAAARMLCSGDVPPKPLLMPADL
jgi:hypothetical protein